LGILPIRPCASPAKILLQDRYLPTDSRLICLTTDKKSGYKNYQLRKKKLSFSLDCLILKMEAVTLVRMVGNCLPVDTFCLDQLVVSQLDKKFSVFYGTRNVIIAVFRCPLPSAYPEPFVALYSLYVIPHFSYGLKYLSCLRHFSKIISSHYCPKKMSIYISSVCFLYIFVLSLIM